MRTVTAKVIGLMIFVSAASAFADTKLPKCVIYTFGHCQGSLKYPNGDIYTGEFNYGQPNGAGKMTYANGDLYAGSFFEGQKHGIGDYTWADGNRYIGQFIEGNLQGRGAYYFLANNKVNPDKYIGDFKKNAFNGDGVYTYGNGAVVSGKFKDGRKVDDLPAVVVAEAQIKTELNSGVYQTNKYQEKNAQDVTVTAIKSNISKGKELSALANASRQTGEKSSLATQLDSQAELDRSLRRKLEIESADAVIAQEMVQSLADENARLKSQIETRIELDRGLRLKLEAASADAVIANEMARSIADENAKLKRQIDSQVELDKSQKLKMETESVAALIAQEKAQSIADENARLKSKIEIQAELDRKLRFKLEAESAVALIAKEKAQSIADENANLKRQIDSQAELDRKLRFKLEAEVAAAAIVQEKAQSIADENARLKSQIEVELEMERSFRIKMEGVQTSVKNNDSEEIIKNTLSTSDAPSEMTTFEKGKIFIKGSLNWPRLTVLDAFTSSSNGEVRETRELQSVSKDAPFGIGIGYQVGKNFGVEVAYKYHGDRNIDKRDTDSLNMSTLQIGSFLDIQVSSQFGISFKGGIQQTESKGTAYYYRSSDGGVTYTILDTSRASIKIENKDINYYYGFGLYYALNSKNSIYLDWNRNRIVWPDIGSDTKYTYSLNLDSTEIGIKHSF